MNAKIFQTFKRHATTWLLLISLPMSLGLGCSNSGSNARAASRDHFVGWFKLDDKTTNQKLIPVLKRESDFYTVCRGAEIPLRPCAERLEWSLTPSSMSGTKIGWDAETRTYYLAVLDSLASQYTDGRYGDGEKEPLTRTDKPAGLLVPEARQPHSKDDFLGCYQPVWFPWCQIEIRKEGNHYVTQDYEFRGPEPGSWQIGTLVRELTPLPDQLGFTGFERDGGPQLIYHQSLRRFELVMVNKEKVPRIIRMPLAKIPTADSPINAPAPTVAIGIPSWH
jgi:hypothetical protein